MTGDAKATDVFVSFIPVSFFRSFSGFFLGFFGGCALFCSFVCFGSKTFCVFTVLL